jgi:predicted dehydrogenase
MPRKYRVAIIGHSGKGNYGHGHDVVWKSLPERFEVAAVTDVNPDGVAKAVERTGAAKGYSNYLKMLTEVRPDIVAVCPRWIDKHDEYAMAVAVSISHPPSF